MKFDKEKYRQLARTEGYNAALTALHRETTGWEYETFEGEAGWSPSQWEKLKEVREFQRELWEEATLNTTPASQNR